MKLHLSNMYEKLKWSCLSTYKLGGSNTEDPPTTPGGMTVHPVTMGMMLRIFDAQSKLWAAIFHVFSPQLMKMRQHMPSVEAIRLANTLLNYALEVLLISKELKRKGGMSCPERHRLFVKRHCYVNSQDTVK